MAAFLANVGVNSAHAARSPLFSDGRFVVLPIPERDPWAPPMLRLDDISGLAVHAPAAWRERTVHLDPDFSGPTPTYADNCRRAGRAFTLRRAASGGLIAFLARLHPPRGPAGVYVVRAPGVDGRAAPLLFDPPP